jgi:hypothetical protein
MSFSFICTTASTEKSDTAWGGGNAIGVVVRDDVAGVRRPVATGQVPGLL